MKRTKKNYLPDFKNQKGAITLFVIIAMIFFLAIVLVMYMGNMKKLRNQKEQIEEIRQQYDEENIHEVYNEILK